MIEIASRIQSAWPGRCAVSWFFSTSTSSLPHEEMRSKNTLSGIISAPYELKLTAAGGSPPALSRHARIHRLVYFPVQGGMWAHNAAPSSLLSL